MRIIRSNYIKKTTLIQSTMFIRCKEIWVKQLMRFSPTNPREMAIKKEMCYISSFNLSLFSHFLKLLLNLWDHIELWVSHITGIRSTLLPKNCKILPNYSSNREGFPQNFRDQELENLLNFCLISTRSFPSMQSYFVKQLVRLCTYSRTRPKSPLLTNFNLWPN